MGINIPKSSQSIPIPRPHRPDDTPHNKEYGDNTQHSIPRNPHQTAAHHRSLPQSHPYHKKNGDKTKGFIPINPHFSIRHHISNVPTGHYFTLEAFCPR